MINIIVAHDRNRVIGLKNDLPWKLPKDLKNLKSLTTGTPIVMGRKTFESIGKVLPERENIVLTNTVIGNEGVTVVNDKQYILDRFSQKEDCFIFGGQSIYEQFLPYAKKIYLTFIDERFRGDTFFPEISVDKWELIEKSDNQRDKENDLDFYFMKYKRIKND